VADDLPVPIALYPLNGRHGTSDISPNKNPPGILSDVHLAPGPYGHPQGSYQFSGNFTSNIEFPNNGGLDTRYSMTLLAWVNRENNDGPIVNYGTNSWGFHFWFVNGGLFSRPMTRDNQFLFYVTSSELSKTWHYVGTTYDFSSGVVKLWVNGEEVAQTIFGSEEQSTQFDVRMGAKADANDKRYFKGRICCLQVYNKSLSQQEIIAVQNRTFKTGGSASTETGRVWVGDACIEFNLDPRAPGIEVCRAHAGNPISGHLREAVGLDKFC